MFKHILKHNMGFKTITIKEDVYRELLRAKSKEESFSMLLSKLVKGKKKKPDISKLYGTWKVSDAEWKKIKVILKKRRQNVDKNYRERLEKLFS